MATRAGTKKRVIPSFDPKEQYVFTTDKPGSDTKRDTHVLSEEERGTLLGTVNERWDEFCKAGKQSFDKVVLLGKALSKLKGAVKNGNDSADTWMEFVEREQKAGNLQFGLRQADRYISIYNRRNDIKFHGRCMDFSFGKGSGGGNGGGEKLGDIDVGKKGTKEWRGSVRWTANGRLTLTWKDEGLAKCMDKDDPLCQQAVEIGKWAFSLVAGANDMAVANRVLDFLKNTGQELAEEAVED